MRGPDWLVARPIAHRGLHDASAGIPENSLAAAQAAMDAGYAIEVDVRPAADGTAMVFHDATLERMTGLPDRLDRESPEVLGRLVLAGTGERIASLAEILETIAGRTPLFVEIKADEESDAALTSAFDASIARCVSTYNGPVAVMSFEPSRVVAMARGAPNVPRGLVSRAYDSEEDRWTLGTFQRWTRRNLIATVETRSHFVAYDARALPAPAPAMARRGGLRLLTWTVRSEREWKRLAAYVDQIIFEGFRP